LQKAYYAFICFAPVKLLCALKKLAVPAVEH